MARTNLPAYTSVYKDPGSVAINTELRRRYAGSFKNDDALTGAVDGMVNADFEGDQMLKDDLSTRYNNNLKERSRRGDYETMGQTIAKDSRQFVKEYAPIEQNYNSVQGYKQSVQKAYNEGRIDEETYRRAFAMSAHGYEGLQQNEDGTVNDKSFFSGYNFVDDQNISALMDDAMKGYAAHTGGSDMTRVGQGPNAEYKMRVGSEWSRVPQAEVDRIFNDVISDPSVRAYLNQKADLRTFDVSDENLQKQLSLNLYGDPDDPNDKGLYGIMSELQDKGKDKEAEAYKNITEQQESLLNGTGVESPEEIINMRKKASHQQVIDSEIGRERNAALTKYVRNNVKTWSHQEYDDLYKMGVQKKIDEYISDYTEDTPLVEIVSESGSTYDEVEKHMEGRIELQNQQVTSVNDLLKEDGYEGEPLTKEQILSGDYLTMEINGQLLTDYIDVGILNTAQDNIRKHISAANRSKNILKAVDDKMGTETATATEKFRKTELTIGGGYGEQTTNYGKILDVMNDVISDGNTGKNEIKEMFSSKHGNDYIDLGDGKIRVMNSVDKTGSRTGGNLNWKTEGVVIDLNNIDVLGYMNIMNQASRLTNRGYRGQGWTAEGENLSYRFTSAVFKEHDKQYDTRIYTGVISDSGPDAQNVNTHTRRDYKNSIAETIVKRDEYVLEASTQYVGGQASQVIPGLNSDEAQKNTKIVNQALNNRALPDHFEIFYDNKKQDGTGTIASFKEQYGISGDLNVKDIKFVTSPFMGEAVLQLQIQGKGQQQENVQRASDEDVMLTRTVFMPVSQIKNSGLQEYINSPAFKVEMEVNGARQSSLDNTTIIFRKGSNDVGTTLTWDFNKDNSQNSETILIQTADGGQQRFPKGHPTVSLIIQEAVNAGYKFWVKED